MLTLIKAEFLKLKRRNKPIPFLISSLVCCCIIFLVINFKSNVSVKNWTEMLELLNGLNTIIVSIFITILTGESFMSEYKDKTVNIAFTYPISRVKIYLSKLIVISLHALLFTLFNFVLFILFVNFIPVINLGNKLSISFGIFKPCFYSSLLPSIIFCIISSFICQTVFSIIYSFFCIVKKSTLAIVISTILCINVLGNSQFNNLTSVLLLSCISTLIGILVFIFIRNTLINKDVTF